MTNTADISADVQALIARRIRQDVQGMHAYAVQDLSLIHI